MTKGTWDNTIFVTNALTNMLKLLENGIVSEKYSSKKIDVDNIVSADESDYIDINNLLTTINSIKPSNLYAKQNKDGKTIIFKDQISTDLTNEETIEFLSNLIRDTIEKLIAKDIDNFIEAISAKNSDQQSIELPSHLPTLPSKLNPLFQSDKVLSKNHIIRLICGLKRMLESWQSLEISTLKYNYSAQSKPINALSIINLLNKINLANGSNLKIKALTKEGIAVAEDKEILSMEKGHPYELILYSKDLRLDAKNKDNNQYVSTLIENTIYSFQKLLETHYPSPKKRKFSAYEPLPNQKRINSLMHQKEFLKQN